MTSLQLPVAASSFQLPVSSFQFPASSFQLKKNELGLQRTGDRGLALADEHVDLRAHAEVLRVDARLDGKAGAGDQPPLVVRLVVVHVHAVAVDLGAEAVPRAMDEL